MSFFMGESIERNSDPMHGHMKLEILNNGNLIASKCNQRR